MKQAKRRFAFVKPNIQFTYVSISPFYSGKQIERAFWFVGSGNFYEVRFGRAAVRAGPVFWNIFKGCARGNPAFRIADGRIVNVSAKGALVNVELLFRLFFFAQLFFEQRKNDVHIAYDAVIRVLKIGAFGSVLIATTIPAFSMPFKCCLAPEMPAAIYSFA